MKRFRALALVGLVASLVAPAMSPLSSTMALVTTTDALVANWQFKEMTGTAAADTGVHGVFHGILKANGTASLPQWTEDTPPGRLGGSLRFNGSNYVEAEDGTGADGPLDVDRLTASAWIKIDPTITTGTVRNVVRKGHLNDRTFGMDLTVSSTSITLRSFVNGGTTAGGSAVTDLEGTNLRPAAVDGTWVHVAMTYDGTHVRSYVNGVSDGGSSMVRETLYENNLSIRIGGQAYSPNNNTLPFKGLIHDVRIYNYAKSNVQMSVEADVTAPVISCDDPYELTTAPDEGEWAVDCSATDNTGLATASTVTLKTSVGAGNEDEFADTDSFDFCDAAGNCTTAGPFEDFLVDRKGPTVTIHGIVHGATFDLSVEGVPQATCTAVDGIDGPITPCSVTGWGDSVGPHTLNASVTDAAGNVGSATAVSYTVVPGEPAVQEVPVIAQPGNITEPATTANGATVTWTTPTATHGGAVTCLPGTGLISIGTTTVTCTAVGPGPAYHEAEPVQFTVTVTCTAAGANFGGIGSPLGRSEPTAVKLGSTVPVKIAAACNSIEGSPTLTVTSVDGNPVLGSTSAADSVPHLRWSGEQYIFNLAATKALGYKVGSVYTVEVSVPGGGSRTSSFKVTK